YVHGPEEPEQTSPLSDYVLGPECLEYLAPADDEIDVEDQPYADYASPIALSLGYVTNSDLEEDSKDGLVDYPADGVTSFEETEPFKTNESATTPAPPPADHTTPVFGCTCTSIITTPQSTHPYGSPNHVRAPRDFRATLGRLRALSPSTHHPLHPSPPLPPLPSLLYLPPPTPTSLPLPSPPLPASLFILPPVDHREDILKAELPPRKRLCLTALTYRYEVGESLTAAARPTGGLMCGCR
nr:hypothetical protein [Tanacetum cinerariifolium]